MLKLIKRACVSIIRIILTVGIVLSFWNFFVARGYNYAVSQDTPIIKQYSKYLRPLKDITGRNYCSSSSVLYKGVPVTVTNDHCCEHGLSQFNDKELRVGDSIERLLYRSKVHDVCVLTSSQSDTPIKVASRDFEILDLALVMGYPRGTFLTPRFGHIFAKHEEICIPKNVVEIHCARSHILFSITYPGNSGSPVFNDRGELTNIIYAGNIYIVTMGIAVPLEYLKGALDVAVKNY